MEYGRRSLASFCSAVPMPPKFCSVISDSFIMISNDVSTVHFYINYFLLLISPPYGGRREPLPSLPWGGSRGSAIFALSFWFYNEEMEARAVSGPRDCAACRLVEPEFKTSFSYTSGSLPWHMLEPHLRPVKSMSKAVLGVKNLQGSPGWCGSMD